MASKIDHNAPDAEWYDDVPRSVSRFALFGLVLAIASFGGFGLWAFRAPLAAAVIAQGSFVATGQNKIVQHLEGGIIKDILVTEGSQVEKGDLLIRLDETVADSVEREIDLRLIRLEATEARLQAEYDQSPRISFPARFAGEESDYEIASIIDSQKLTFKVSKTALEKEVALLQTNIDALEIRAAGYSAQHLSSVNQYDLLCEELLSKSKLLDQGLARRSEVAALRRTLLEAEGQIGRLKAQIDEINQLKLKYQKQIEQVTADYSKIALKELQAVQAELDGVREKARAARSVRQRTDVMAPVSGTVVRLFYHTSGGVIESGRPILEILPMDEQLIIEVVVSQADIDTVHTGQPATVRLTALNRRTTPILNGTVFYVSADSISDTSTGIPREVYIARVSIEPGELERPPDSRPTPGMPAQVMIQSAERTFAEYISKPIKDSMNRAFREQ